MHRQKPKNWNNTPGGEKNSLLHIFGSKTQFTTRCIKSTGNSVRGNFNFLCILFSFCRHQAHVGLKFVVASSLLSHKTHINLDDIRQIFTLALSLFPHLFLLLCEPLSDIQHIQHRLMLSSPRPEESSKVAQDLHNWVDGVWKTGAKMTSLCERMKQLFRHWMI